MDDLLNKFVAAIKGFIARLLDLLATMGIEVPEIDLGDLNLGDLNIGL